MAASSTEDRSEGLDQGKVATLESLRELEKKIGSVKMLPDVALKALEVARDSEACSQALADVIQQDFSLATDVLAMANSALYSMGTPASRLTQAIVRIGFRKCRNIIVSSSLASMMKKMKLEEQTIRDVLWKHSLATGVICTRLNDELRLGFDGEEFAAGLVHDFGRTLLAIAFPDTFRDFDVLDFDESVECLDRERTVVGTDHCEFGSWYARQHGLPSDLAEVIRCHHNPAQAHECRRLVALVATADHLANHFQRGEEPGAYVALENPGISFLEQADVEGAVDRFQEIASDVLERSHEMIRQLMSG